MDVSRRDQVRSVANEIGDRIRCGRALRRMSREQLGAALGVTFQQVQKYESGKNRVAACTLVAIAIELDLDVGFFLPRGAAPIGKAELAEARAELVEARVTLAEAIEKLSTMHGKLRARETRIEASPMPAFPELYSA